MVSKKNIVAMMSGTVISLESNVELPRFDERLSFTGRYEVFLGYR